VLNIPVHHGQVFPDARGHKTQLYLSDRAARSWSSYHALPRPKSTEPNQLSLTHARTPSCWRLPSCVTQTHRPTVALERWLATATARPRPLSPARL
jgi:hypothetical protein